MLDEFTVKPLDQAAIVKHVAACGGRIVEVEDHYPGGDLNEAVKSAVAEQHVVNLI